MLPLVWLTLLGAVNALPLQARQSACAPVHLIVARGSTEAQGEGAMKTVADKIKARVSGADSEAIVYPATLNNYASSVAQGTAAMTKAIKAYVDRCPNSKIVLLGYSQGGQVTLDTLCGTSSSGFATTSPLETKYGQRIFAAVPYGEPTHRISQPYNAGTSTKDGIFPRQNTGACSPYNAKLKSYCDSNDQFCDSGNSGAVHQGYFSKYSDDTANFVVAKVN